MPYLVDDPPQFTRQHRPGPRRLCLRAGALGQAGVRSPLPHLVGERVPGRIQPRRLRGVAGAARLGRTLGQPGMRRGAAVLTTDLRQQRALFRRPAFQPARRLLGQRTADRLADRRERQLLVPLARGPNVHVGQLFGRHRGRRLVWFGQPDLDRPPVHRPDPDRRAVHQLGAAHQAGTVGTEVRHHRVHRVHEAQVLGRRDTQLHLARGGAELVEQRPLVPAQRPAELHPQLFGVVQVGAQPQLGQQARDAALHRVPLGAVRLLVQPRQRLEPDRPGGQLRVAGQLGEVAPGQPQLGREPAGQRLGDQRRNPLVMWAGDRRIGGDVRDRHLGPPTVVAEADHPVAGGAQVRPGQRMPPGRPLQRSQHVRQHGTHLGRYRREGAGGVRDRFGHLLDRRVPVDAIQQRTRRRPQLGPQQPSSHVVAVHAGLVQQLVEARLDGGMRRVRRLRVQVGQRVEGTDHRFVVQIERGVDALPQPGDQLGIRGRVGDPGCDVGQHVTDVDLFGAALPGGHGE
ncbi:hypothetical protein GCM10009635_32680 [Actinocatenispora thailandica]